MRGWSGWSDFNLPPGVYNSDPYFTQEDDDFCEHSAPTCAACQEEQAKAEADEKVWSDFGTAEGERAGNR